MSEKANVSLKNVSSTKKSKKLQKQSTDPINEKYHKLLLLFEKVLTDWKKCSVSGSSIINEILAKKKEQLSSEEPSTVPFSLKLQKNIEKLNKLTYELDHSVQNLEDVAEKFEALMDLKSLSLCDSNLSVSTSVLDITSVEHNRSLQLEVLPVLVKCYKKQTELNHTVAENIGRASSLEHTVYYTCIWNHQPEFGNEFSIGETQLTMMLQM